MKHKSKEIAICGYCGIDYEKTNEAQKHCCRSCAEASKGNKVLKKLICPGCNNEFVVKQNKSIFCSNSCRRSFDNEKRSSNTSKLWPMISELVLERDGYKCKSCGASSVDLLVHHVVPLCRGGDNRRDNLITLCDSCHGKAHKELLNVYNTR